MGTRDSHASRIRANAPTRAPTRGTRWTADRQLRFLAVLARTRSVTKAARAAGMSRESAYRLRARDGCQLFAAAWDQALKVAPAPAPPRAPYRRKPGYKTPRAKVTKVARFFRSRRVAPPPPWA